MKIYKFDRSEFKWAEEYYDLIQNKMDLPEWFGKNADALWDMLTGILKPHVQLFFLDLTI